MVIVSIVPYRIFPAKLGGQKGIAVFNEYLAQRCKLISITVKSNQPSFAKGYTMMNVLSDSPLRYINIFTFFTLRRIIRLNKATHLLLEHPYYGWLGFFVQKFTGVKLVIHSHNIEAIRWKTLGKWWWWILGWYEGFTHRAGNVNFFIHDDDRAYAIRKYELDPAKCATITYGIDWNSPPSQDERERCKEILRQQYQLPEPQILYLFNGTLDYKPNLDAVSIILETINPQLIQSGLAYKIIICGKALPDVMNELKAYNDKNIIYAGFVEDVTVYFKGTDVFINPVVDGGGIKTKLVEALGYNTRCISTENGSIGVGVEETGGQLVIVPNNEWQLFVEKMIEQKLHPSQPVPVSFYNKFYWGNIAKKAVEFLNSSS